jgi:hypothetical protein
MREMIKENETTAINEQGREKMVLQKGDRDDLYGPAARIFRAMEAALLIRFGRESRGDDF